MTAEIIITVDKQKIPSGVVLIEDVASLAKGLYDSILRLIQNDLGYPSHTRRFKDETKQLAPIGLVNIKKGSGILQFEAMPIDGYKGRHPALVATSEIVSGIQSYRDSGRWPAFLPNVIRTGLGDAIESIAQGDSSVKISVTENGTPYGCKLDHNLSVALKEPEKFSCDETVKIIGKIFDLNIDNKTFKVDTSPRRVIVTGDDEKFGKADSFRWQRVFVTGLPSNDKCSRLTEIQELRLATDDDEDGISIESNISPIEVSPICQQIEQKINEFLSYKNRWDTYKAEAPSSATLKFALEFIKNAYLVLYNHSISIPETFVVPTKAGGIQFEWEIEGRELELEIVAKNTFKYLAIDNETEKEGSAFRWQVIRLLRWVVTGDEI